MKVSGYYTENSGNLVYKFEKKRNSEGLGPRNKVLHFTSDVL